MTDPSRPRYEEHRPAPALADVVACYWTLRGVPADDPPPRRVLPDGCTDLLFDLAGTARVDGGDRPERYAVGTMERAIVVRHAGPGAPVDVVGVRLRPGAARALVRPPAHELTDAWADLDALWGPSAAEAWSRLGEVRRSGERVAVLDDVLTRRFGRHGNPPDRMILAAARRLMTGLVSVGAVAEGLGASRRHLERRFRSDVGVSPGILARVGRLERAARLIRDPSAAGLAGVAREAGYHDQPHMTREFREMARVTPGRYRRESRTPAAATEPERSTEPGRPVGPAAR